MLVAMLIEEQTTKMQMCCEISKVRETGIVYQQRSGSVALFTVCGIFEARPGNI